MRRFKPIDRLYIPSSFRIAPTPRDPVDSFAIGGLHSERALDRNFRNSISIDISYRLVHYTPGVAYDHMGFPRRIFVPYELRIARGVGHDVQ